jgi:hypothetical protein
MTEKTNRQWLFMTIITVVNVLIATGYSVAGILNPALMLPKNIIVNESAFIFALYAGARTIPLAFLSLIVIFKRYKASIITLGLLAGCIQFFDGFIGIYQRDIFKSGGPFFIAIVQIIAIYMFRKKEK